MNTKLSVIGFSSILILVLLISCNKKKEDMKPPVTDKIQKELMIHGDKRIDNYFWLNDKKNPKVIDYLNAENNYTESVMKHTEDLQKKIYDEIVGRIKQSDETVPFESNGYWYYRKFEKGKEYPVYCRKKETLNSQEEILLDVNESSKGYKVYRISDIFISPDNKIMAYGVDTSGDRRHTIFFKDLSSGKLLGDLLYNTSENVVWANDNKTLFYITKDETVRSYKVFRHKLGEKPEQDIEVFHEKDISFETGVSKSKSQKFIFISSVQTLSSEVQFLDADNPASKFTVFQKRQRDLIYSVEHHENKFIIRNNDNAKNFKISETPINKTTKDNWKDFVSHDKDVLIENMDIFSSYLVMLEKKNGLSRLRLFNMKEKYEHFISFNEESYDIGLGKNEKFNSGVLRFVYTSLTTPSSTYDYNMNTKERKLLKEDEVVGGYDKNNYETKRLFATGSDGVKIPISIVYKKGLNKDGSNPLLLYGYGSYGINMSPSFSSVCLSLLNRGFVYAIAHVRGGQEMGRYWYEDGKLLKKKNTFTDFISCAEFLIAEKYTNPQKLFATGRSAGGLLMGAIVNMRPDLFKGIIAGVPWVDVITDMLDETIPLTSLEWDEWGNPNKKEYYDYMLSYSPYDQVKTQSYPAILATGGLNDSQVSYWNPAKWVAKLRELKTDKNLLLLKTNMGAGHGGASGRFERYKLTAFEYSFILDLIGINK